MARDSATTRRKMLREIGMLLRWLWGRAGDDAVRLTGDPAWADYLRRMLAAVTR